MNFWKKSKVPESVYVDEAGKSVNENRRKLGIGAKIFCVVAAFLLWLYVSGDQNFEKTFENLPVVINGEESIIAEGLEAISKSDAVATVTVTGKRSQINSLRAEDLHPSVSLKGITSSQQYSLPVKVETPAGVSVASVYPESVNVYIDSVMLNTVPVTAKIVSGGVKDMLVSDVNVTLDVSEITVKGPSAVINRIAGAVAELELGGTVSSSVDVYGNIALVDEKGEKIESEYVVVTPGKVSAHIPVFASKSVKVVPDFGDAHSEDYRYEVSPKNVIIRSEDANLLESMTEIKTRPITVGEGTVGTFRSDLVIPEGVTLESEDSTVTVKVVAYSEKIVDVTNILFINLRDGLSIGGRQEKISVRFTGSSENLASLTEEKVYAVADLASFREKGEYSVSVVINTVGDEEVYTDGKYSVKVTLDDSDEDGTET